MTRERKIIVIAGPNGAGKTAFAREFLPQEADLRGSQPALERAARNALVIARRTRTPCYVLKNGKVTDIAGAQQRSSKRSAAR